MKITACLITCNEEDNLPRCLASVAPLVDEIVIVDSGSGDGTRGISESFSARFITHAWEGYVGQKNFALDQATHNWVLSIDADEEISPELATELRKVKAGDETSAPSGYEVSRLVCYRGQWIRHGDWFPDRLVRLFRRDRARFAGGRVHERLEVNGPIVRLPGFLHHFTYRDPADRARRIEHYARLWAESAHEKGRTAGPLTPRLRSLVRLLRGYVIKRGFLDGEIGWEVAVGNAREVYLKYQNLRALTRGETVPPTNSSAAGASS